MLSYSHFCWKEVIAYLDEEGIDLNAEARSWAEDSGHPETCSEKVGPVQKYLIYGAVEIHIKTIEVLKVMEQITRQSGAAMEDFVLSYPKYDSYSSSFHAIENYRCSSVEQKMLLLWLQKSTRAAVKFFLYQAECIHCSYKAYYYHIKLDKGEESQVRFSNLANMLSDAEGDFCKEMDALTGINRAAIYVYSHPVNYELIFCGRYYAHFGVKGITMNSLLKVEELFAKWQMDKGLLRVEAPSYPVAQAFVKAITSFLTEKDVELFEECSFDIKEKAQIISESHEIELLKVQSAQPSQEGRDIQLLTMSYASGEGLTRSEIPLCVVNATGKYSLQDGKEEVIFRAGGQDQPKNALECSDRYVLDDIWEKLHGNILESKHIKPANDIRGWMKDEGFGGGSLLWEHIQPSVLPSYLQIPLSWHASIKKV